MGLHRHRRWSRRIHLLVLLAMQGRRTLILDRLLQFPRFHIGESLIPET